jgi:hypothetical protein
MRKKAMILAALVSAATPAAAERLKPVTDDATRTECSACHMAFQPQMLAARAWHAIMGDLSNHFGEDASLDPATAEAISAYLAANAADAPASRGRWMRGIAADQTITHITETPNWIRHHKGEVSPAAFENPKVKTKANCVACHRGADQGFYDDD